MVFMHMGGSFIFRLQYISLVLTSGPTRLNGMDYFQYFHVAVFHKYLFLDVINILI